MPQPFGRGKSVLARANYKLAEPTWIWPSIGLGQMLCGRVFDPSRQNLTRTLRGRDILLQELGVGRSLGSAQTSVAELLCCFAALMLAVKPNFWPMKVPAGTTKWPRRAPARS